MVACSNGAQRIPGNPKYVRVTEADIERWYPNAGAIFYLWMRPYVGRVYDIDAIAALNPDVPATSTWQDFLVDALHGWGFGGSTALSTIADNQIIYWLFLENCQCIGGSGALAHWISPSVCTTGPTQYAVQYNQAPLPAGTNRVITGSAYLDSWSGATQRWAIGWSWGHGGTTQQSYQGPYWITGTSYNVWSTGGNIPDDATWYTFYCLPENADSNHGCWHTDFTFSGNGVVTSPPTPTEPSYTDLPTYTPPSGTTTDELETKLDALISLLSSQHDLVTVTQRQISPFAYIKATASSVSGSGMLQRSGMIGALVHLNSTAALWSAISAPDFHMDAGWLSFGTADGWTPAIRLTHQDQLCLVPSGVVDRLAYYIAPSTSAVITPLLREP